MAKSIVDHVARLLGVPSAAVYALDSATGDLRLVTGWTSFERGFFWSTTLTRGTGVVGAAHTRREAFATDDMLNDPRVSYGLAKALLGETTAEEVYRVAL